MRGYGQTRVAPRAFAPADPSPATPVPPPPLPATPAPRDHRLELLPSVCPNCSGPIRGHDVKWTGPQSADCPYCGANLPMAPTTAIAPDP